MKRVLFVCLGNICRSPAAEGVFRAVAAKAHLPVYLDSAGTGSWHEGAPPDKRMTQSAKRRGVDIKHLRARQVELADFYEFDYILTMDMSNQADMLALAPANRECDIRLFLDFSKGDITEVPDPYYGSSDGFEHVLTLLEDAAEGLLHHLENEEDV